MTRINVGIPPKDLSRQHLIAEHREIKRIPNMVREGKLKGKIPAKFCLGTGHVQFFANKLGYLHVRYMRIYQECLDRGYNVQNYSGAWDGLPDGEYWEPTESDIQLIKQRIEYVNSRRNS